MGLLSSRRFVGPATARSLAPRAYCIDTGLRIRLYCMSSYVVQCRTCRSTTILCDFQTCTAHLQPPSIPPLTLRSFDNYRPGVTRVACVVPPGTYTRTGSFCCDDVDLPSFWLKMPRTRLLKGWNVPKDASITARSFWRSLSIKHLALRPCRCRTLRACAGGRLRRRAV